jgi:hypothetical protein
MDTFETYQCTCHRCLERRHDIACRRALLPEDLLADPSYDINSPIWDTFRKLECDPSRRSRFLDDDQIDYNATLSPVVKVEEMSL